MSIKGLKKDEYDVVIIGAGIGGLVCGCYLAKAGMKVLIAEQHYKAGGYCQSFTRKGFTFDAGIHALGSCRDGGYINMLLRELDLFKEITIVRKDPSEAIITPDFKVDIRNNINDTIEEWQRIFPSESSNINSFFKFVNSIDVKDTKTFFSLYSKLKGRTFLDLLDGNFKDNKPKAILTALLGNMGLPASQSSALNSLIFYREFILDGGYYPIGSTQALTDTILNKFKELGGEIVFSTKVKRILIKDGQAKGISLDGEYLIKSKYVVSNCDARQTFLELVGEDHLKQDFISKLKEMVPSISAFIVYLGIDSSRDDNFNKCGTIWYLPDYKTESFYLKILQGKADYSKGYLLCTRPTFYDPDLAPTGKHILKLMITTPFMNAEYWEESKKELRDTLVSIAGKVVPHLNSRILVDKIATPLTLYKYTLNFHGALCGWAAIPRQAEKISLPQRTKIKNLLLAGHWVSQPGQGGLPMAVFSGRKAASIILNK